MLFGKKHPAHRAEDAELDRSTSKTHHRKFLGRYSQQLADANPAESVCLTCRNSPRTHIHPLGMNGARDGGLLRERFT